MIERFERFSLAISEIDRYWHKIAGAEMEKYGLRASHSVYLVAISRFPEGITAAKLCDFCRKDKADVSRAMSLLEKEGFVSRKGNNQTRYRAPLKLTEKGKQAVKPVKQAAIHAVELAGTGISEEHRKIFYNALEQISSNLQKISEEGLQ